MTKPKNRRAVSLEELGRLAEEGVNRVSPMSQMERSIEELKRKMGQTEMDKRLAELEPTNERAKPCPLCGKSARVRTRFVSRTFQSMSGTHTIRRHYHYCEVCRAGFYPLDDFLGLPKEGALSSDLEMRIADFALNDAYEMAEERWNLHYPWQVSANQFRQVAKRLGRQIEATNEIVLQGALLKPELNAAATLYAMNDGGMVPMRGKWSEVKVGVLFREENHLSHRLTNRGQLTRARYVAVLGGQDDFSAHMQKALQVENGVKAKRIVWLADGAIGNWHLAMKLCPDAIQILDWYHAVENAMACGRLIFGETSPLLMEWKLRVETLLWAGNPGALLEELMACVEFAEGHTALKALNDLLRYYRNNKSRIRYADYIKQGLLIGSGIVESAHRHVIQARMKRAGQHWGERGGRQMARMRAAYKTSGPTRFYSAVHWAFRESAKLRTAAPAPRRRYASNR